MKLQKNKSMQPIFVYLGSDIYDSEQTHAITGHTAQSG